LEDYFANKIATNNESGVKKESSSANT